MNTADILLHAERDAAEHGFFLCPDKELLDDLIEGLATNEERHGYGSCPCRVAVGSKTYDGDIICPCEYRDADVDEFGMCYCALFVSKEIKEDPSGMGPIPERRPVEIREAGTAAEKVITSAKGQEKGTETAEVSAERRKEIPVWRCEVCGYLCARERPPPICPICKAKAERFHPFGFG